MALHRKQNFWKRHGWRVIRETKVLRRITQCPTSCTAVIRRGSRPYGAPSTLRKNDAAISKRQSSSLSFPAEWLMRPAGLTHRAIPAIPVRRVRPLRRLGRHRRWAANPVRESRAHPEYHRRCGSQRPEAARRPRNPGRQQVADRSNDPRWQAWRPPCVGPEVQMDVRCLRR